MNFTINVVTDGPLEIEHYVAKFVVPNQAAMLLLDATWLDWAWREDTNSPWQLIGENPTQLSSWSEQTQFELPDDVVRVDENGQLPLGLRPDLSPFVKAVNGQTPDSQGQVTLPDAVFEHVQSSPAATWTIFHGRNERLGVIDVLDSTGTAVCFYSVYHVDNNTIELGFSAAMSGRARLA